MRWLWNPCRLENDDILFFSWTSLSHLTSQAFNPKFIAPMRYFSKEDLDSDNGSKELTYSSSRLVYEDITRAMSSSSEEKRDERKGSTTDQMSSKKIENSEKLVPSFFSRTYTSWILLTEKMNVYTPVWFPDLLFLASHLNNSTRVSLFSPTSHMSLQFKKVFTKS